MLSLLQLADAYQATRPELIAFLTSMTLRPDIAEELAQEAALRLVSSSHGLADATAVRPWLFRVGARLAIDHSRKRSTRHELVVIEARRRAEVNQAFSAESRVMVASPEMAAIAQEHLRFCLMCTMRNLEPQQSATLLLVDVYGFRVSEAADLIGASFGQAKHWLQAARETLRERYEGACALVSKQGVCHQCSELNAFFNGAPRDPLEGTARDVAARTALARARASAPLGRWHALLAKLIDDLLTACE